MSLLLLPWAPSPKRRANAPLLSPCEDDQCQPLLQFPTFRIFVCRALPSRGEPGYEPLIAYKRFEVQSKDNYKWKLFELEDEEHIGSALVHLDRVYTKAAGSMRKEST